MDTYKPDEYSGPEPSFAIEGGKVYKGSCHCGAVTLAVKSKPLEGDPDGVLECNCSGCVRVCGPFLLIASSFY